VVIRGVWNLSKSYGTLASLWRQRRKPCGTGRLRTDTPTLLWWLALLHFDFGGMQEVTEQEPGIETARPAAEQRAFGPLFAHYHLPLLEYPYSMTRDRAVAEDLDQEMFLRAYGVTLWQRIIGDGVGGMIAPVVAP
jgi:hypothetical protein